MDIGIIANPASGKDIRRLTAQASVFSNQEKSAMLSRCLAGIYGICPSANILYYPDSHRLAQSATVGSGMNCKPLDMLVRGDSSDSTHAAEILRSAAVVISLGGDGTNRAIAKGLGETPLIALSTGTNNAFPVLAEATTAGMAAALIAKCDLALERLAPKTKIIHLELSSGLTELALVDLVATEDRFTGSRAITDPGAFVYAVVSFADPSQIGMSGIAGMVHHLDEAEDRGLELTFTSDSKTQHRRSIRGAVAPGVVKDIAVSNVCSFPLDEIRTRNGATMLALDGEREISLKRNDEVSVWIARDGPRRVDIAKTLQASVDFGKFTPIQSEKVALHAN